MKIVVQASGGIESTTLIGMAIEKVGRDNVHLIAFDTGSIFWNHRDSIAVKRVATNFQLQQNLFICKMPQVDTLEYVRDARYADVGFLPGFKLMFNVASLAYAQRIGAEQVWIGNMHDNEFPDETPEFIRDTNFLYNRTYTEAEGMPRVTVETPFAGWDKAQVIQEATKLGINIADTVSCGDERLSGGFNCGVCPWCTKRRKGFALAGVPDRTRYLFWDNPELIDEWPHFNRDEA